MNPASFENIVDLYKVTHGAIRGYIAIDQTLTGPALGGTRVRDYATSEDALEDAKKLARLMSYKCAIAGLPFGGGKGVIMADPSDEELDDILKIYAGVVDSLKGTFYTGEDMGLTEEHVQYMLQFSPYFIGKSDQAGDPSGFAAQSAFSCLQVGLKYVFGNKNCERRVFAIKGVGKTGAEMLRLITEHGGVAIITDTNRARAEEMAARFPQTSVLPEGEAIEEVRADALVPCAAGGDINSESISHIQAKLVCGTANNQLQTFAMANELMRRHILYVPDFIANAGGLIDVADELLPGGYNRPRVDRNINNLAKVLEHVLRVAVSLHEPPHRVAERIALESISRARVRQLVI